MNISKPRSSTNRNKRAGTVRQGNPAARPSLWKRLKRWLRDYKWPLIGFMWVVKVFVINYIESGNESEYKNYKGANQ